MGRLFESIDDNLKALIETIAHLRENGRICLMFNSFDGRRRIVRLHGTGTVSLPGDAAFEGMAEYRVEKNTRSIDGLPGLAAKPRRMS
ncbi:pyridoxamine 5'-phosphate oxidase family protein [Agromyces humatus]|uniref:Uncharacterized protein n=1 Tax=Agromyces humatus TaxID=279573 RepID=A0ABN2KBP0_9MICO|nr:pyridoxamine 5'-phosphate oxidase family protein [Agromyces humatus]